MSTALRIVRPLPAADQRARELVLGSVVFARGAPSIARPDAPKSRAMPGAPQRSLAARVAELERRLASDHQARKERRVLALACLRASEAALVLTLIEIVSVKLHVPAEDILGTGRQQPAAWARQISMCLARRVLGFGEEAVSLVFRRNRTTVSFACRKVASLVSLGGKDAESYLACREAARALLARELARVAKEEAATLNSQLPHSQPRP